MKVYCLKCRYVIPYLLLHVSFVRVSVGFFSACTAGYKCYALYLTAHVLRPKFNVRNEIKTKTKTKFNPELNRLRKVKLA